jgi:hypothetical protein
MKAIQPATYHVEAPVGHLGEIEHSRRVFKEQLDVVEHEKPAVRRI